VRRFRVCHVKSLNEPVSSNSSPPCLINGGTSTRGNSRSRPIRASEQSLPTPSRPTPTPRRRAWNTHFQSLCTVSIVPRRTERGPVSCEFREAPHPRLDRLLHPGKGPGIHIFSPFVHCQLSRVERNEGRFHANFARLLTPKSSLGSRAFLEDCSVYVDHVHVLHPDSLVLMPRVVTGIVSSSAE
jgi:hypothetical protein